MQSHPAAKGLFNKPFPYYDELAYVFGCDRMMDGFIKTFDDVGSNKPVEYKRFDMLDGNEEFPSMYSQGIDMSQEDVRASRPSHTSKGRIRSSGSKRKRESQQKGEIEVIHMAIECTNDQLRAIVEWPARALANDTHVRQELLRLLHVMPELTSLDRALCQRHLLSRIDDMRGFIQMIDDERQNFCRVLLGDISR
ncbi:hypothetical protein IC575_022104 [Cucumis melo]